jgi:hypothetical protein
MNPNQTTACTESPLASAANRLMRVIDENGKLIQELQNVLVNVLRPSTPSDCKIGVSGESVQPKEPLRSPMADGVHHRAAQVESQNAQIRDILARIEL